jgi:UDP-glucose 4-epimerase
MAVLITGGAGYIGSHMTHALTDRGERVVVDNLSTGVRKNMSPGVKFFDEDVSNGERLRHIIHHNLVDTVMHFAGSVVVPESVTNPLWYYANNTAASRTLIEACVERGVKHFVFSSSAAVYGQPARIPVQERTPPKPVSPYGWSKLMTEQMLEDTSRAHDFRYIALRYFNVAGADPLGRAGQSTPNATHLIKRAVRVALGRERHLEVYGTDWATNDGTASRDYIHVSDLVDAHLLALDALRDGGPSDVINCGYGRGVTVREVIEAVERVSGQDLPVRYRSSRAGDVWVLIADTSRLKERFGWEPKYNDLETIVRSAFEWERDHCG